MAALSSASAGGAPSGAPASGSPADAALHAQQAFVNPYVGNRNLSETEQQVLGEYARLAATISRISALSTSLASTSTHHALLSQLRVLERKMGLVLTLFKASVWAVVMTQGQHLEDEAAAAAEAEAEAQAQAEMDAQNYDGVARYSMNAGAEEDGDTIRGGYGAGY